MKYQYLISTLGLVATSCATLNDSIELGAGMGGLTGATATYAAYQTTGRPPTFENVALGAGIGISVGVLTSYFVHKQLDEQRKALQADQIEMQFGDLPPSPFVYPKKPSKKGNR